jgi:hypothetical protein
VRVEFGGTDLGLTTDDGVTLSGEMTIVDLTAPQSVGVLDSYRQMQNCQAVATFRELTLAKLKMLQDLTTAPSSGVLGLTPQHKVTKRTIVITTAGPGGTTRVYTGTAGVVACGEIQNNTADYAGAEVTFQFYINPTTNTYATIADGSSSETAPAISAWEYFTVSSGTTLTDGATDIPIAAKFRLTFNVEIRPDQLTASNFILKTGAGNTAVASTIAFGSTSGVTDFDVVEITPSASLGTSTAHDLIVVPGILSISGIPSTALAARQFTTASS